MSPRSQRRLQKLTIIAKDPSVTVDGKTDGKILTTQVEIPSEELSPGPRGYRVQVVDFDASNGLLYPPLEYRILADGTYNDPFVEEPTEVLVSDPAFHAQNVYAIVMRILARFEQALGRRVTWSFGGHQLQVAPHAFLEANAYYSKDDRALLFGYFPRRAQEDPPAAPVTDNPEEETAIEPRESKKLGYRGMVFTCLSHDVVAHETTHALLDGLRERYTDPSSPEQAGFHEGFADIVALLSILSLPDVVRQMICPSEIGATEPCPISSAELKTHKLRQSLLSVLGQEVGKELIGRGTALRRSIAELKPSRKYLEMEGLKEQFEEPHRRGELLVAAAMNAYLKIWRLRIKSLFPPEKKGEPASASPGPAAPVLPVLVVPPAPSPAAPVPDPEEEEDEKMERVVLLDRNRVVEEGATIADQMLTMVIRALDYCPPTDLQFCDYLSALLTADREMRPDDSKFQFRETLRKSFESYGFLPTSKGDGTEPGIWEPPDCKLRYDRVHLESMSRDRDEMFRFIWENRIELGLDKDAYTRVLSVRPAVRVNPEDGFVLRETVAEYHQILNVLAAELKHLGIRRPKGMSDQQHVTLYGGGALVFDEFGRLKFHIRNRILNPDRQTQRLKHLWKHRHFDHLQILEREASRDYRFARMHLQRFGSSGSLSGEDDDAEYF